MKVKVGEIYKPISGHCGDFDAYNGSFVKITKIDGDRDLYYDILDKDKNQIFWCGCFKPENLEPIKEETTKKMKISEYTPKVGDRIKTNGDFLKICEWFEGVVGEVNENYFYVWVDNKWDEGERVNWIISRNNKKAEVIILNKEDSMKNMKYGVAYEQSGDLTEYFKTEREAKERIEELLKDSSVSKIYLFEIANLCEVVRNEYKLVPVEKRGRPRK